MDYAVDKQSVTVVALGIESIGERRFRRKGYFNNLQQLLEYVPADNYPGELAIFQQKFSAEGQGRKLIPNLAAEWIASKASKQSDSQ